MSELSIGIDAKLIELALPSTVLDAKVNHLYQRIVTHARMHDIYMTP